MNNILKGKLTSRGNLNGNVNTIVFAHNYNDLINKPKINNVTLQGNKTASELGLATPSDITVTSVNEQTGDVVLSGSDIDYSVGMSLNAKIDDLESQIQGSGVQSVNGKTGNVTLTSNDINYSTGVTIKNKIDSVEGEIPDVYVSTVNGNSGAVTLTGSDIEYSSGVSVNSKIDAVEQSIPVVDYPVTSVNEQTGDVELNGTNIPMSGTDSTPTATAIGDLSDLTTSVTSSLVGAINEIASYTPVYGNTASGTIATFDTSLALPLQDLQIAINAVQESGTPTPSSPKAISGFTGANIHVADGETPHVIDNVTPITWQSEAGTVYGGSLDVTTGALTITHTVLTFNGSENWTTRESGVGTLYELNISEPINAVESISNMYVWELNLASNNTFRTLKSGNIRVIGIHDDNRTDLATFKSFLSNNNLTICYELATPVTYQLTPTQISAIVGTNNVFTDTNGDTSVVYACSLKDYIDSQ